MIRTKFPAQPPKKKRGPKDKSKLAVKLAFQFALLGASNKLLAEALGVSEFTISEWMKVNPDFSDAVTKGKTVADAKVARSLYLSALGYSHPDSVILTNTVKEYDENGKIVRSYTEPLIVPTVKHYPPNAFAAFKWLTIRQRAAGWADVTNINIQQDINIKAEIDFSDMNDDELKMLENIGIKQITQRAAQRQLAETVGRS